MNLKYLIIFFLSLSFSIAASGQNKKQPVKSATNHPQINKMDLSKITNEKVKSALEAWQKGDSKTFLSFFIAIPKLTDDGNPRDFSTFVKTACGHELFTSIDNAENNGLDIYGNFHTESWGNFKTYFKFHQNTEGKFDRLDIGQANY